MLTLVRPVQSWNAPSPINVTELGMVMLVSPLQPQNASSPIDVTELGISMLVRPLKLSKAELPIAVTVLGIIVFSQPTIKVLDAVSIIALQLLRESYFGLPLSTTMLVRPVQLQYL